MFSVGDLVISNTSKPQRFSRKPIFIPGVIGGVGGSGAAYMHVGRVYKIAGFTPNGGVLLHGFTLPVSAKELLPATEEALALDRSQPVSAANDPCTKYWCYCRSGQHGQ